MGLDDAGLTRLTDLDLFGARITDYGTNCFRCKSILQNQLQLQNWLLSYEKLMCSIQRLVTASLYFLVVNGLLLCSNTSLIYEVSFVEQYPN
jgi:hypothetical protein